MGALLVKQLLWRCSETLTDTSDQFTRYPEQSMVLALRAGVRALCKFVPPAGARTLTMKLASGTRQSIAKIPAADTKVAGATGTDDVYGLGVLAFIRNMGANGLAVGKAVGIGDRQRLDLADPDWHTKTDTAVRQCFYDPQDPTTFYVTPGVPAGNQVWMDVSLMAPPKPIADGGAPGAEIYKLSGGSAAVVGVDDQYEDELYNYVVAYLLMSNAAAQGAMARASVHAQAFTTSINMLAQLATGHNPNLQRLPFAPEVPGAAS